MAALTFNAQEFESQRIPDPLPAYEDPFPADCGLTADQKSDLGKHSEWLGLMDTPERVIAHWQLVAQYRAEREALVAQEKKKDPAQAAQMIAERAAHANVVNSANIAWREAIKQRAAAMLQWDAYVKQKHEEFKRLKNAKV